MYQKKSERRYTPGVKVGTEDGLKILWHDRVYFGGIVDLSLESGTESPELLLEGGIAFVAPERAKSLYDRIETEEGVNLKKIWRRRAALETNPTEALEVDRSGPAYKDDKEHNSKD
ncbi:hypothetical protein XANCAGTX0491_007991 [Xanthoria calcicola]